MVELQPIGQVRNGITEHGDVVWEELVSEVVIEEQYAAALQGIEEFSHVWVIFWLHQRDREAILKVHPEGRPELPEVGVLATRSPRRPTPIAMTAVQLLERRGHVLVVRGLDALDGTPVLDIKPYLVRGDLIPEATVPGWLQRLWQMHDAERPGPCQSPKFVIASAEAEALSTAKGKQSLS
jgi:tRNA-Thr(GGU) m(6)t(6)A37 methyltransferase TsaA